MIIQKAISIVCILVGFFYNYTGVYAATDTTTIVPTILAETLSSETQDRIKDIESITTLDSLFVSSESGKNDLKRGKCPKSDLIPTTEIPLQYVNLDKSIESEYTPADLVDLSQYIATRNKYTVCMTTTAASALIDMSNAMEELDMKLIAVSGYRSHSGQKLLYTKYSKLTKGSLYPRVAPAGHSEHQLGTAIDIAGELSSGSSFAQTIEGKWVDAHAHEYGFILSYPKGGEQKTGYMYEPWHLRYVGKENASILRSQEYTLAFKTHYYKKSFLSSFLDSLKKTIDSLNGDENIGG